MTMVDPEQPWLSGTEVATDPGPLAVADHVCGCDHVDANAFMATSTTDTDNRETDLARAVHLEALTVAWNLLEGAIALTAALKAGSVAIMGFGIDSFVECASALVMLWRLRAERRHRFTGPELERLEHRARRLIAASLFLLAAYVGADAARTLWTGERPEFSPVGVTLLVISIAVMLWLARAKRRLATALGSQAMAADAVQTTACFWLSMAALVGVSLNGALGWWWADPAAALVISALVAHEGREAWHGKDCC
ncbi:MAG: cation transporter [Candidatus Sericytochromatia bacterium]|nr:cation transporter [Candidatus Sericytochromatia bacterium]